MKITALETSFLAAPLAPPVRVSNSTIAQVSEVILESFADPTRDPLWFELFRARPEIVDGFMAVPELPASASSCARTRWRSTA